VSVGGRAVVRCEREGEALSSAESTEERGGKSVVDTALHQPERGIWSGMTIVGDEQTGEATVGVLGIPFDGGVSFRSGAAAAPAKLRELSNHLARCADEGQPLSLLVRDYGDVPVDLEWSRHFQSVEEQALDVIRHPFALFLGGDHSVSIPLMRACDRGWDGPFGLLHFDAHPDLFDVYSGHRWSHACTERRALELTGLDPERLVLVGIRSVAAKERAFLQEHPEIPVYTARECHQRGMENVAAEVIALLHDVGSVYVTVDIDGLDPAFAPGTGYPEAGGPSARDLLELIRTVCQELPVRAMDLVEVSPPLDHADITSFAALKVIYEAWYGVQRRLHHG
jgi:agmatinase